MKALIHLALLAGLAAVALSTSAAPRAAEDPTAVVLSTNASAPRVKQDIPRASKAAPKHRKAAKHGAKKGKAGHAKKTRRAR